MFEMPRTMVRKMMGPITIFTSLTKVSPTGRMARPSGGANAPRSAPSATAHRTWKVRWRTSRLIGRSRVEGEQVGSAHPEQHAQEQEPEQEAERPEGLPRDVPRGVVDRGRAGGVRRQHSHHAERVAGEHGEGSL